MKNKSKTENIYIKYKMYIYQKVNYIYMIYFQDSICYCDK